MIVTYDNTDFKHSASIIAERLSCAVGKDDKLHDLTLTLRDLPESSNYILELCLNARTPPLKLVLDFNNQHFRFRKSHGGGKRQHIVRAMGLHKQPALRIIDATAGMGADSFVLACHSANMTLVEQHPILSLMLENAVTQALEIPELSEIASRMHVCSNTNSIELLSAPDINKKYDVIYLDPMYPERNKKQAKAKKNMQIIQYLLADFENQDELLFNTALASGVKRIVVKRPIAADSLLQMKPHSVIESTNTRYDIYINKKGSEPFYFNK